MESEGKSAAQLKLEQVCIDVKQWRETRPKLGQMPAELWDEATSAARELGVYPVARALGINYTTLKERTGAGPKQRRTGTRRGQENTPRGTGSGFIEVSNIPMLREPAGSEGTTVVEVVAADGARLTIRLQGKSQADVAGLVTAFQGRRQ